MDALEAAGPCSMRELASLVGRPPDALYYHVGVLRSVGLLLDVPSPDDAPEGRIVDVALRPLYLHYDLASKPNRDAVCNVVAAMTRSAERHFRRAYRVGSAKVQGPHRDLWAGRCQGWLSENDVVEVNQLLDHILSIVRKRQVPRRNVRKRCEISFVLAPLPQRRKAP